LPGGPGGCDPSVPDRHRPVGDQVQLSLQAPPARTAPVEDAGELGGVDDIQVRWHGTSGKPEARNMEPMIRHRGFVSCVNKCGDKNLWKTPATKPRPRKGSPRRLLKSR